MFRTRITEGENRSTMGKISSGIQPTNITYYVLRISLCKHCKFVLAFFIESASGELKETVEKTQTRIIGPPTTLINEAIFLSYQPSNEGKLLKPSVLGVKAKPVDHPEPPGKVLEV
ncbi:hypothetical protein AVEN_180946-1 [Araneus ventricosus]|uniref:Uncharacterized protein n=1 Tax=Araneus ventricosus TaxID=182803 RepID=A0A4Y2FL05_ARAVE|nr:hypothetical protein AVEN_180946-1 [Araneus ventricosus]